jgi:hypothetical protein
VWVPGHCGIHRNEKADTRTGSSSAFVGPELCLGEWFHKSLHLMEFGDCLSSVENVAEKTQSLTRYLLRLSRSKL